MRVEHAVLATVLAGLAPSARAACVPPSMDPCTVLSTDADLSIEGRPQETWGIGDWGVEVADFDTDGVPDLIISGGYDSGSAYIVYGAQSGVLLAGRGTRLTSAGPRGELSLGVGVGDANGDGTADAIVGADGVREQSAYLFLGPITANRDVAEADARLVGPRWGATGRNPLLAPDFDGDGQREIVLDDQRDLHGSRGSVFVIPGDVTGRVDAETAATHTYWGHRRPDFFGVDTEPIGDRNGDGIDDLALASHGAVFLVDGGGVGGVFDVTDAASVTIGHPNESGVNFKPPGFSLAAADYDGDGTSDLFVGDTTGGRSTGAVGCFRGPVSHDLPGTAAADTAWLSTPDDRDSRTGYLVGVSVAVGDVDGDAAPDVVMGAIARGPADAGVVYLQLGPATGTIEAAELLTFQSPSVDKLGDAVATIPDWTGDGADEIVMSAPDATNASGEVTGEVYVFFSDSLFP